MDLSIPAPPPSTSPQGPRLRPLPLRDVQIADDFWGPRVERVREVTLDAQHRKLVDTGRLDALRLDWSPGRGPEPHIFWDSDVAKWIEAASYSLATRPDAELERQVDEAIALLAGAQQPDGYLNVYFTVVRPGQRWTDLRDAHELYCAGHLIEAGVAHAEATGKSTLLDVVIRYADHIGTVFGPGEGQLRGYPGHEEIELALVKLARLTGERRYLDLAAFFVDERGTEPFWFDLEEQRRGDPGYFGTHPPFDQRGADPEHFREYNQSHAPVREQSDAVGHSVRAMYLYSAMADLAAETGDSTLLDASRRLWTSATGRRMYVTGGLGSTPRTEGFTADHDLPNETAYAETCASIGLVFWAQRMALLERDAGYVDVLERALYNGVLSGISADGTRFFYENPLASAGDHHRQEWFGVACCPPNLARLLTSLGGYLYAQDDDALFVQLYLTGSAQAEVGGSRVTLQQQTDFPWDGSVRITVHVERATRFRLALRVPSWCEQPTLDVAGEQHDVASVLQRGYAVVDRTWQDGDVVELELPMRPVRLHAHPAVAADAGRVALQRGPFVHCVEETDNGDRPHRLVLPAEAELRSQRGVAGLEDVVSLRATAERDGTDEWGGALYRTEPPGRTEVELVAVPYYAWDNRAPGRMEVWLRTS